MFLILIFHILVLSIIRYFWFIRVVRYFWFNSIGINDTFFSIFDFLKYTLCLYFWFIWYSTIYTKILILKTFTVSPSH